jgi:amino-acid N-acetyltransferase
MVRKAQVKDAKKIQTIISFWARQGKVLERSLNYIYENIRDFWVYQQGKKVVGACALHIIGWHNLAEIKSLVLDKNYQRKGIGSELVSACIDEAKSLGVKYIFVLTFIGKFFKKFGFKKISKDKLPHKIWSECIHCVYFPKCKEEALILELDK